MNAIPCDDVRAKLPLFLTADLPATEADAVRAHLAGCAGCAADHAELLQVRRLLDAAPCPPVPPVDVAAVYRAALATHARSARRWKRTAAVGAALAAGLLGFAILPKFEVKLGGSEFVVRWGDPPAVAATHPAPSPTDADVHARLADLDARTARLVRIETKVQTLQTLLLALADDLDESDELHRRQKDDLTRVATHLRSVEAGAREQFRQTERTNAALYTLAADKARPEGEMR